MTLTQLQTDTSNDGDMLTLLKLLRLKGNALLIHC